MNLHFNPQSLTVQILCRGEAIGLQDTLCSLKACHQPDRLWLEVQLLPWQLQPGGLERLTASCANDPNLVWWSSPGPCRTSNVEAEARGQANQQARGAWIWWLEAGDSLQPEALVQWAEAAGAHPEALLIAGDGEQLNDNRKVIRRHGALPVNTRLRQLVQEQLYCPGALCIHQRLLRLIPLPLSANLSSGYREAWLVEVLEQCRERVMVMPQRWVQTQALVDGPLPGRCRQRTLDLSAYLSQHWGESPAGLLHRYGLQLQLGEATVPAGSTALSELASALKTARPWLGEDTWRRLELGWGLNHQAAPWQKRLETCLLQGGLEQLWCVTLLRNLLHPELGALQLGSPWGPNVRLAERLLSPELWSQYRLLRQDADLLKLLNMPISGVPLIGMLHWQRKPDLQDHFLFPDDLKTYCCWWAENSSCQLSHIKFNELGEITAESWAEDQLQAEQRLFGVNLIGHAFEVFGVGEDARMAKLALESSEVPFCIVNVPANNGTSTIEPSLATNVLNTEEIGPYCFNLVCLTAVEHGKWIAQAGLGQQQNRITIVTWPWETQTWPTAWHCLIRLADAFWPASNFTASALAPFSIAEKKPLVVMPMTVHIEEPNQLRSSELRNATRSSWDLDSEAALVLLSFDVRSSIARKNPWGAITAFQQAFPKNMDDRVQMAIKTLRPAQTNPEWDKLQSKIRQDSRLRLIEADLDRNAFLALMGCSDVFISLHRSEGFGRGIAEAALLGLEIVVSAFGGNMDFCNAAYMHLVPCRPWLITADQYPESEGHLWGDPDINVAAKMLKKSVERVNQASCKMNLDERRQEVHKKLNREVCGRRYREELLKLMAQTTPTMPINISPCESTHLTLNGPVPTLSASPGWSADKRVGGWYL